MANVKLTLSYKGTDYSGFQTQPNSRTIEDELKVALGSLYNCDINLVSCGRTDAGVHASGHVVNYQVEREFDLRTIKKALNGQLPQDIQVQSVSMVENKFHSRFSAKRREYRYLFSSHQIPIMYQDFVTKITFDPDEALFSDISSLFIGEKDFQNFRNNGSNKYSSIRHIFDCGFKKFYLKEPYDANEGVPCYEFYICGNSFLYRMVRNILGAVFEVLQHKQSLESLKLMISSNKKLFFYTTVPAKGLNLYKVSY